MLYQALSLLEWSPMAESTTSTLQDAATEFAKRAKIASDARTIALEKSRTVELEIASAVQETVL